MSDCLTLVQQGNNMSMRAFWAVSRQFQQTPDPSIGYETPQVWVPRSLLVVFWSFPPSALDGDIRQLERRRHGLDDGGQYRIGVERRMQTLPEPRQHGVRFVALTIEQPIHHTLHMLSQGLERHCDNYRWQSARGSNRPGACSSA